MRDINVPTTTIRIKFALRDILKRAARKDGRTLAGFIEQVLMNALNRPKKH